MLLCSYYCISYFLSFTSLFFATLTSSHQQQQQFQTISQHSISTKYGLIRGLRIQFGWSGNGNGNGNGNGGSIRHLDPITAYLGLPYASPPINAYRFMPPVAPLPWSPGTKLATTYPPACPQRFPNLSNKTRALETMTLMRFEFLTRMNNLFRNQSEDCLYLNLYVPAVLGGGRGEDSGKYPILFVIHGESWDWGSGNEFDGSVLASMGRTIVVTFNYRLGILGFLKTSNQQSNFGLLDVIAALHWVHENGNAFGGDPNRITLLGYRTGAAVANLLLVAQIAKDLFARCILIGGTVNSPWAIQSRPEEVAVQAARHFSCPTLLPLSHPESDIAPCLRQKHLHDLMTFNPLSPRFLPPYAPWVDNVLISQPLDTKPTQLLLLFTTSEGFNELSERELNGFEFEHRDRVLRTLVRNVYNYHQQEIFSIVKNEYTDWERPMMHPIPLRDSVVEALSDALVIGPLIQFGLKGKRGTTTWMGHFSHVGGRDANIHERLGSLEGDVVPYAMGLPIATHSNSLSPWSLNFTKQDAVVAETLIHFLSNFVRSGNPNTNDMTMLHSDASNERIIRRQFHWEPFDQLTQLYANFGAKPRLKSHYRGHRLALWINLIPQIHGAVSGADLAHHTFQDSNPAMYSGMVRSMHPMSSFPGSDSSTIPPLTQSTAAAATTTECLDTTSFPHLNSLDLEPYDSSSSVTRGAGFGIARSDLDSDYSTALTVTLTVGVCLILLNLLVFSAIICSRNRANGRQEQEEHNLGKQGYQEEDDFNWVNYVPGPCPADDLELSYPPEHSPLMMAIGPNHQNHHNCQNYCNSDSIRVYMNDAKSREGNFDSPSPIPQQHSLLQPQNTNSNTNTLQVQPSPPTSSSASTPNATTGLVSALKRHNHVTTHGPGGGNGVKKRVQIQEISV